MRKSPEEKTTESARGKWSGVLQQLGVSPQFLNWGTTKKHVDCPICDAKRGFRFDNREGRGTWICKSCGAGDGMDLAIRVTGEDFKDVAKRIDGILGVANGVKSDAPVAQISDEKAAAANRRLWSGAVPIAPGSPVDVYLSHRHLNEMSYPDCLRFEASAADGEGGVRPAMLALVRAHDNKHASVHRTFLTPDGRSKAEMGSPRKMMAGRFPQGGAVRLSGWNGGVLGIAEGIETAMAAANQFQIPVWAAVNANMLEQWVPPAGCTEVAIFGDNDASYTGQAAAFTLARKLTLKKIQVHVHIPGLISIPEAVGDDWADVYEREQAALAQSPVAIAAE